MSSQGLEEFDVEKELKDENLLYYLKRLGGDFDDDIEDNIEDNMEGGNDNDDAESNARI